MPQPRNAISTRLMKATTMKPLLVIAGLSFVAVSAASVRADQKPVEQRVSVVNSQQPPGTLAEMIASADAVVIARPTGKTRLRDWGNGLPVETIYTFRIEDAIKFSPVIPAVGDTIEMDVLGGEKETSTRIVRDVIRGHGSVQPNARYLIFVRWVQNPAGERLVPCWGNAGIIDITGQRAKSLADNFKRYNETDSATFVANVRATSKQGR